MRDALGKCDTLILCLGSHSINRTQRNPWIAIERIAMIKLCFTAEELRRIKFYPLLTYGDMLRWTEDIMVCVDNFRLESDTVGIFGYAKDDSSWYLNEFPSDFRRMFFDVPLYDGLSATDIRKEYFENEYIDETTLPPGVVDYLENYIVDFNYRELPLK